MHLYRYPKEAEDTGDCLSKIPKRLRELSILPQGCDIGWGLQCVEGLDWIKLWALGFIGFLASSTLGFLWSVLKDDVQSGFAVAACMVMGLFFTIGIVQAAYEPKGDCETGSLMLFLRARCKNSSNTVFEGDVSRLDEYAVTSLC